MTPSEPTQVLPSRPRTGSDTVVTVDRDRRRHRFIKWLIAIVVVALLAIAAMIVDQTFRARAEKDIATTIATSVGADASTIGAVSYTHLTLPTILLV